MVKMKSKRLCPIDLFDVSSPHTARTPPPGPERVSGGQEEGDPSKIQKRKMSQPIVDLLGNN